MKISVYISGVEMNGVAHYVTFAVFFNKMFSFRLCAFYGFFLSALILSDNVTHSFVTIFLDADKYTLGNFGGAFKFAHIIMVGFATFVSSFDTI